MHEDEVPHDASKPEGKPTKGKKKVVQAEFLPASRNNAKVLSGQQVDFYNGNGYVHPITVFEDDAVTENQAYIDSLMQQLKGEGDGRDNYALLGYHTRCAGLYDIAKNDRILDAVQDIIGPDIICWTSHLFCKIGHDTKSIPFHQDASYWKISPTRTVSAWLAIDDSSLENSCMHVIPRTHLLGFLPWSEAQEESVLNQSIDGTTELGEPVPLELEAGQISLHADLTAHGSKPNKSGKRRCGYVMRFCPSSVKPLARSWGQNAILCRGEDREGNWKHNPRPPGDDVETWEKYYVRMEREKQT